MTLKQWFELGRDSISQFEVGEFLIFPNFTGAIKQESGWMKSETLILTDADWDHAVLVPVKAKDLLNEEIVAVCNYDHVGRVFGL